MRLRTFAVFLALTATIVASPLVATAQGDRPEDRKAIRDHIDRIFQAFIKKDAAELRATHAQNWLGYLEGSRKAIHGVDGYMDYNYVDPKSPYGMKGYKMREFDMIFQGDAAFVANGKVTPVGLAALEKQMPYADLTEFKKDPRMDKVEDLFTVDLLVRYLAMRLGAK